LSRVARAPRARFALAFIALFAIYGVSTPYLQLLVRGLGYGPAAVGVLLGLFEIVGIAGPLVIARRADASGRYRPSLLATAALVLASLPLLVLVRSPFATAAALVLLSLGLRSMIPLLDAATVAMGAGKPGWDYGKLRAFGSAGFVLVALGLQLVPGFDRSPPERIALFLGAFAALFGLCLFALPEPHASRAGSGALAAEVPKAPARAPAGAEPPAPRGARTAFLVLGLCVIALGRLGMAPINSFFSLYLVDEVKWDAVGGMWALSALSEIPLMILSGLIVARLGPMRSIALGSLAIALRLGIYAAFPSPAGVAAGQLLHSLCFGLLHPAGVAFAALAVPPARRAQGMALYMGLGVGLPSFAGSALGGGIVQAWGYRALFGSFIAFALAAAALYLAKRRTFETP
jgi:MFS transporter, PPP family, 3-phenylpropionic acid transporter